MTGGERTNSSIDTGIPFLEERAVFVGFRIISEVDFSQQQRQRRKREVCAFGLPSNLSYFYVTISLQDPCADGLSRGKFQLWSFQELMLKLMISFRILYTQAHPPHPFRFT